MMHAVVLPGDMRSYGIGRVFRVRGSSRWYVGLCIAGEEYRESSKSRSRQMAVALLKRRLAELAAGTFCPTATRTTVGDLLTALLAQYEAERKPSLRTVRGHVNRLRAALGTMRAADLTTAQCWELVSNWRAERLADATINRHLETLRRAYRLGAATTPPTVAHVPGFPSLTEENVRSGYVDRASFVRVHGALVTLDPVVADLLEWAWWTGRRWGAIARLEWSAVDRETCTFTVPGSVQKGKKPIKFPLTAELWAIIERCHARRVAQAKGMDQLPRWLFWRVYDGPPRPGLRPGDACRVVDFRKVLASAFREAGVVPFLVHDLRRTALRNLRRAGVDRRTAMLLSGHTTEATFERYLIDRDLEVGAALEKVTAYVRRLPRRQTS